MSLVQAILIAIIADVKATGLENASFVSRL